MTIVKMSKKRKRTEESTGMLRNQRPKSSIDQEQLLELEQSILESRKNYNNLVKLIKLYEEAQGSAKQSVSLAVSRVLSTLINDGKVFGSNAKDSEAVVQSWLQDRLSDYTGLLLETLRSSVPINEKLSALNILMHFIKVEGSYSTPTYAPRFPLELFRDLVKVLRQVSDSTPQDLVLEEQFWESYADKYEDIRLQVLQSFRSALDAEQDSDEKINLQSWIIRCLFRIENMPIRKDDMNFYCAVQPSKQSPMRSITSYKRQFQETWMVLLRSGLNKNQRKVILKDLSKKIAPHFVDAEVLMDFLMESFAFDESVQMLSLSGLYYLMAEKNLDCPSFYPMLYSLLTNRLLHSKYRSEFFRLLEVFLSSSHLPAALVASFIKRMSRLALYAPPAAIVVVIPWVYNLLKRHPTCTFMIHRESVRNQTTEEIAKLGMTDPFDMDCKDPINTRAIDSCLWELYMLRNHYNPNLATFAKIISEQFTKPDYKVESFLDDSYRNMLEIELNKTIKNPPFVEPNLPKNILARSDGQAESDSNVLLRLWNNR